jgi:tRNA(Ile)-lysidine synthase
VRARSGQADTGDACLQGCVAAVLTAAGVASGRLVLGLSGGMDSMVLLDLLSALRVERSFDLQALHVNHQLSPNANKWSALCAQRSRDYGVPLRVVRVEVERDSPEGLEAAARNARYAVFEEQDADAVVLAHHLDDQAETLLLQLLRGAGPRGLAAMPAARPIGGAGRPLLVRPLLEVERSHIDRYARRHGLTWVDDESNADTDRDRNYLRHEVLPRLSARFPGYRQTWLRASRNFADLSEIADAQAQADAADGLRAGGLLVLRLRELSPARAANLLRWYLVQEGLPVPRRDQLEELLRQTTRARGDAQPSMELGGARVYRHRGLLRIVPAGAAATQPWQVRWRGEPDVVLPGGLGRVRFRQLTGVGLSAKELAGKQLVVRARSGGERIKLVPNRPTRTLKNLLQEAGVPQWQRDRLPLLACDGDVLWVAQLGIDCRFAAAAQEPGVLPTWLPG